METSDARLDGGPRGQEGAPACQASTVEHAVLWTDETPVGRLAKVGSAALSVQELLTLLLRARGARENLASVSARLATRFPSMANLAQAGLPDLIREGGLSLQQAATIIAARELGRWGKGCRNCRVPCFVPPVGKPCSLLLLG